MFRSRYESENLYPRLRPVQAMAVEREGQRLLLLRDPTRPDGPQVLMSSAALALAALLDGTRDQEAVLADFTQQHGVGVAPEAIAALVRQLDEALLLDSPRYRADLEARRDAYRAAPLRPMILAPDVFPSEARLAAGLLDGFYTAPGGPGRLPRRRPVSGPRCRGVLAPHIDFQRGDGLYGQAYLRVAEAAAEAELFVLIGTDHRGELDAPVTLTAHDFETPFGRLQTDHEAVWELAAGTSWLENELAHREEHSLELQAVMLHRLLLHHGPGAGTARARRVRVLPVLCGALEGVPARLRAQRTAVEALAAALGTLATRQPTCVIAGVDLAHLGPAFGTDALADSDRRDLRTRDQRTLGHVERADAAGFLADALEDGNARQICSVAGIYLALLLLGGSRGELLGYRQCPVPGPGGRGACVSIAAAAYYDG